MRSIHGRDKKDYTHPYFLWTLFKILVLMLASTNVSTRYDTEATPFEPHQVGNGELGEEGKAYLAAAERSWAHVSCFEGAGEEEGGEKGRWDVHN